MRERLSVFLNLADKMLREPALVGAQPAKTVVGRVRLAVRTIRFAWHQAELAWLVRRVEQMTRQIRWRPTPEGPVEQQGLRKVK